MNTKASRSSAKAIILMVTVAAIIAICSSDVIAKKTLNVDCYTDEWQRTNPDLVVYAADKRLQDDCYVDHFLVSVTPGGDYLATWQTGTEEGTPDMRVVYSRSKDGGYTWSEPKVLASDETGQGMVCTVAHLVISKKGRIYCFYNKFLGVMDGGHYHTGVIRVKYSDDDGYTWIDGGIDILQRRTRYDHPDPKVGCKTNNWTKSIRDSKGRVINGFTRWSSFMVYPRPVGGNRNHLDAQCELFRLDNIDENPEPKDIKITWLPDEEGTIRISPQIEPEHSRGYSLAVEPSMVLLPDDRLFMTIRTVTGRVWYTVSDDDGHSWREPEVLLYRDGGREVHHPKAPCPIFGLKDGRFLLFYHNNDGYRDGATGPWDMDARRPLYFALGEFRPGAHQPIWFSDPQFFADTQKVGLTKSDGMDIFWLAMYASVTEHNGERIFWYPDRKHFALGRYMPDEMLAKIKVPKQ